MTKSKKDKKTQRQNYPNDKKKKRQKTETNRRVLYRDNGAVSHSCDVLHTISYAGGRRKEGEEG